VKQHVKRHALARSIIADSAAWQRNGARGALSAAHRGIASRGISAAWRGVGMTYHQKRMAASGGSKQQTKRSISACAA